MPMLFVNLSMMSRVTRPEVVENRARDSTVMRVPTPIAVRRRGRSNLSFTAETTTSSREISDVSPARNRLAKNSTPNSAPAGIWLMIVGKATNARPIPDEATSSTATPDRVAMNPSAANTPIPASTSNEEFANAVTMPVPVRFVLGLR